MEDFIIHFSVVCALTVYVLLDTSDKWLEFHLARVEDSSKCVLQT